MLPQPKKPRERERRMYHADRPSRPRTGSELPCRSTVDNHRTALENAMRTNLLIVGLAGLIGLALMPRARAEDLGRFVEGAIIHRSDARRYEEQAHRRGRPEEERYWHDYGAGLEKQGDHR
jgi:hypothetical protein